MNKKLNKIEFEAMFKKADLFNETLHIIVYPKGSITKLGRLCELEECQKIKIVISVLND